MDVSRAARRQAFAGAVAPPVLIAHGGGNSPANLKPALAMSPDFVEVDLWVHEGRFEARHERRVPGLPLLFEEWYLRIAPRHPFGLVELLEAIAGRCGVFLDLKNGGETAARLIRRAISEAHERPRIVASSQQWGLLRALARIVPEVDLFYSIDVQAKLDLFLSVEQRDPGPLGVSCNHKLLTSAYVSELKRRDLVVVAWTVDDWERAAELVAWGVDAITTHKVSELRGALAIAP